MKPSWSQVAIKPAVTKPSCSQSKLQLSQSQ